MPHAHVASSFHYYYPRDGPLHDSSIPLFRALKMEGLFLPLLLLLLTLHLLTPSALALRFFGLSALKPQSQKQSRSRGCGLHMNAPNFESTAIDIEGSLLEYLQEAKNLGPVRFVVVGSGAILETVGSFDNLRFAETAKGILATVSTEQPNFECHIRMNEIKEIRMVEVNRGGKDMYISRFIDAQGSTVLSSILHGEQYIGEWKSLKSKFIKLGEEGFEPAFSSK